jgi:hypothetical protein
MEDAMRRMRSFTVALLVIVTVLLGEARAQQVDAPADTRLFMGPTARMLAPGEGYIAGYGLLIPTIQVGVTKRFSMGAGVMPIGLLADVPVPFWITPKVQLFDGRHTDVAAGVLHSTYLGRASMGIAYVVTTTGDETGSLTVGGGLAYAKVADHDARGVAPMFQLGGARRVNKRVAVVTENYFDPTHGVGWLSGGVRLYARRFSFDLGLVGPFAEGELLMVGPVVNWAWKF